MPEGRRKVALAGLLTQLPGLELGLSPVCVPRIPEDMGPPSREAGGEQATSLSVKKLNILP